MVAMHLFINCGVCFRYKASFNPAIVCFSEPNAVRTGGASVACGVQRSGRAAPCYVFDSMSFTHFLLMSIKTTPKKINASPGTDLMSSVPVR